jgi:hypothetical protein
MKELNPRVENHSNEDVIQGVSLQDHVHRLPEHQRRLLSNLRICAPEEAVWTASRQKNKLTIASDGGLKGSRGTFG